MNLKKRRKHFTHKVSRRIALLSLLLLAVSFGKLYAQTNDPIIRIELPIKYEGDRFYNVPCDTAGFLLLRNVDKIETGEFIWQIDRYNRFFKIVSSQRFTVNASLGFKKWIYKEGVAHFLFYSPRIKQSKDNNTQVVRYDIVNNKVESIFAKVAAGGEINHLVEGVNKRVYFSMQIEKKQRSELYYADFQNLNLYNIPFSSIPNKAMMFEYMLWDKTSNRLFFALNIFQSREVQQLSIYSLNHSNNIAKLIDIKGNNGKKFNDARMIFSQDHKLLIIGTYDLFNGQKISKEKYFHDYTTGFYSIALHSLNQPPKINYYNFLEFENVVGNLKSEEFQKKKKKKKEDLETSLEYNVLLHDLKIIDGQIYLVAEAYYAKYHTETSFYYDYYNRSMPITTTIFDGYQFFNTFIGSFNQNGKKLWDNSFEIFNILTFEKEKRIISYKHNNSLVFAYNYEGKIAHKIFNKEGKIISGVKKINLGLLDEADHIMDAADSGLRYWFGNHFIAYGREVIVNNENSTNARRYVYYLNMLGFR